MEKVTPHGRSFILYLHPRRRICYDLEPGFHLKLKRDQTSPELQNCAFNIALQNQKATSINVAKATNINSAKATNINSAKAENVNIVKPAVISNVEAASIDNVNSASINSAKAASINSAKAASINSAKAASIDSARISDDFFGPMFNSMHRGTPKVTEGTKKQMIHTKPSPISDDLADKPSTTLAFEKPKIIAAGRKQAVVYPVADNLDSHDSSSSSNAQVKSVTPNALHKPGVNTADVFVRPHPNYVQTFARADPSKYNIASHNIPTNLHDSGTEFEALPESIEKVNPTVEFTHDYELKSNVGHGITDTPKQNIEVGSVLVHTNPDITLSQALDSFVPAHPVEVASEPVAKMFQPHLAMGEHIRYVDKNKHPVTGDDDNDVDESLSEVHVVHHNHHQVHTANEGERERFISKLVDANKGK